MFAIALLAQILFVPLDDRPVTRQLPEMLGRIAGVRIVEPPQALLGNYLTFGNPDTIIPWLNQTARVNDTSFVISSDMLAYGGLVASRVPDTSYADAHFRLRALQQLRNSHPKAWLAVFGTIMRLAPTAVPAIADVAHFFASYPTWTYLQEYANLHDPPLPSETERANQLRSLIGDATLQAYLAARARNYGVDVDLLQQTKKGTIDHLVLGQDDAGPTGLHVKEVHALQNVAANVDNASIEPGTDELGMVLVANALARRVHWHPHIAVRYSSDSTGADAFMLQDPREYAPIPVTIASLIALCGGVHDDDHPDIILYVRLPRANLSDPSAARRNTIIASLADDRFIQAMRTDEIAGKSVALADLTFLESDYTSQAAFAERLLQSGIASRLDAYASWNTNANTVGNAIAEAIAVGAGRRAATYDPLAHRECIFTRFLDDYAFHDYVRPELNATLDARGITDHTYLVPPVENEMTAQNDSLLRKLAPEILAQLYPGMSIATLDTTLPWNRTFETEIMVRLRGSRP